MKKYTLSSYNTDKAKPLVLAYLILAFILSIAVGYGVTQTNSESFVLIGMILILAGFSYAYVFLSNRFKFYSHKLLIITSIALAIAITGGLLIGLYIGVGGSSIAEFINKLGELEYTRRRRGITRTSDGAMFPGLFATFAIITGVVTYAWAKVTANYKVYDAKADKFAKRLPFGIHLHTKDWHKIKKQDDVIAKIFDYTPAKKIKDKDSKTEIQFFELEDSKVVMSSGWQLFELDKQESDLVLETFGK